MITIRCAKCKAKVLKYKKIGKGKVLKCLKDRIQKVHGELNQETLRCQSCGSLIGTVHHDHVKMIQSAFTFGGRID